MSQALLNLDLLVPFERTHGPLSFDLESFRNKGYLTHNFHPFPAKFVPQIPRGLIERYSCEGQTVLDPFCGSGTTLVEAIVAKRRAIGLDVNPIATLVSRAKTSVLNQDEVSEVERATAKIEKLCNNFDGDAFQIPDFKNRDHWFQTHVQKELAAVRNVIFDCELPRGRDFLATAFSAIIVRVSNQDSDTRWVAVTKKIDHGFSLRVFVQKVTDMLERLEELRQCKPARAEVLTQCSTDPFPFAAKSIDLIVTSPPYLNSFDYYLYHKLRFFWLGFDHLPIQERELGSRNRHCDKGQDIETYAAGISIAIKECHRVLKASGNMCIVIGDAIFRGKLVDMKDFYTKLAEPIGFRATENFSFDQRKYSTAFTRNYKTLPKRSHVLSFAK